MRLPRRIFLNVVIFVSSFLVVSYHFSSIVPQDGTVHNVLYRYLFRTIFLFRPRAPAAPCSRSFLLSYCSTPPLKRKIKFSLQTVPFVPTPAAFFFGGGRGCYPAHIFCRSGAAWVGIRGTVFYRLYCYRRHSLPGSLFYTGCYPAHNSGEPALESPAQFTAGGLLSAAQFRCGVHRRAKKMVVIGRTIRTFFCGRQVVIHSTICAVGKIRLLLSAAHFGISSAFQTCPDRVVIQRTFPAVWLLSGAQFLNCRILAAVVIDGTFLKKSTVQRTAGIVIHGTIRFFRGRAVVIRRTIRKNPFFCGASCRGLLVCAQFALQEPGLLSTAQYKDFSARVVIQRTFPRGRIFPSALLECCAHFSLFLFSRRGLLYSTLFKNPTKFSLPPFSCKKTFLPLLHSAHCCVLHIRVGMLRTAPL
mgnify:CR=1 FL=1